MPGWRLRARKVIRNTIAAHADLRGDLPALVEQIDAAYPFGMRSMTPYKIWLEERAKAISELSSDPSERICPTCAARPFRPCRDVTTKVPMKTLHEARFGRSTDHGPLFGGGGGA